LPPIPATTITNDWAWASTGHDHGQFTVSYRTSRGHVCGLVANVECAWPWKNRGISLDDSSDVARTPCGLLRGRQPVCFVICGVDFSGNCQVTCEPFRQQWRGHSPALCDTFPAKCPGTARKLPGNCLDDSPDAAWTAARTAAEITKSFANHCANFGANFGADSPSAPCETFPANCPDVARTLRRTLRGICAGTD